MRVDHVFDAVRDDLSGRQRVKHSTVAHGNAVVHRDRVELPSHAAGLRDRVRHDAAEVAQVHMAGDELGKAVRDRHDRLTKITVRHTGGTPQGTSASHITAVSSGSGTQSRHRTVLAADRAGRTRTRRSGAKHAHGGLPIPARHNAGLTGRRRHRSRIRPARRRVSVSVVVPAQPLPPG